MPFSRGLAYLGQSCNSSIAAAAVNHRARLLSASSVRLEQCTRCRPSTSSPFRAATLRMLSLYRCFGDWTRSWRSGSIFPASTGSSATQSASDARSQPLALVEHLVSAYMPARAAFYVLHHSSYLSQQLSHDAHAPIEPGALVPVAPHSVQILHSLLSEHRHSPESWCPGRSAQAHEVDAAIHWQRDG